uniref:Uncharacterized protein n=1 Tax=Anopheles albimanus TaxID=7167 RepID=A0A182F214_ANOAL
MMSPESNGEPEPVAAALFRGHTPHADPRSCSPVTPGKRMRFTDGGDEASATNSSTSPLVAEALNYSAAELLKAFGYGVVGSVAGAKRSISRQGGGAGASASEDEMLGEDQRRPHRSCDPESGVGVTGSADTRQAGDRSASSSSNSSSSSSSSGSTCPTVIYGTDNGVKCDTLNNNNSLASENHNIDGANGGGGADGDASCDNNNSIKEMDDGKFSEFSKFLADSEKDESMATILELLHVK